MSENPTQVPETAPNPTETVAGIPVAPEHVEFYKQLEAKLQLDFEQRFLIWKKNELANLEMQTDDKVRDLVSEYYDKWKAEQQPLTAEELSKLLSQEYQTITVKVFDSEQSKDREFVLRELPGGVERKFYRLFKDRLKEYGPLVAGFIQANMDATFDVQIASFMETFDNAFDVLAETVALCLDPFGKENIKAQWVMDNMAVSRQWNVVTAQFEISRLRDFFSNVYRAGQKVQSLTTPVSYRGLLEQSR